MKPNLAVTSLTAWLLPATLCAAEFVLVAPDIPPAPIIVFQDAPPRTRDAAVTLAEYIEKLAGGEEKYRRRLAFLQCGLDTIAVQHTRYGVVVITADHEMSIARVLQRILAM